MPKSETRAKIEAQIEVASAGLKEAQSGMRILRDIGMLKASQEIKYSEAKGRLKKLKTALDKYPIS